MAYYPGLRRPSHGGADRNRAKRLRYDYRTGSPLARGRGSKHQRHRQKGKACRVAPRTGARIETTAELKFSRLLRRRPSHGGADRNVLVPENYEQIEGSPLARGRGSKHDPLDHLLDVVPRRPSHGGADRNSIQTWISGRNVSRPSHGGADRNNLHLPAEGFGVPRSPLARGRGSKPAIHCGSTTS